MSTQKDKTSELPAPLRWPILIFLRYYRNLGLRVSFYVIASLLILVLNPLAQGFLSEDLRATVDADSVLKVLTILASSMLAVSTFSLNIMITSHRTAATTTTPRVHRMLLDDTTTQATLATFIGAFVYSLSSVVLFESGVFDDRAAFVAMVMTVLVVALVILAMLRWIEHLSDLGSVDNTLDRVSDETRESLKRLARAPALGGAILDDEIDIPAGAQPVVASRSGYIQLIDVEGLHAGLHGGGCIYVTHGPGDHVIKGEVIAHVTDGTRGTTLDAFADCFVIADQRSYEQDPLFGLTVLSEIASRALSPGVNDPGTAIDVIMRLKALVHGFSSVESPASRPVAPDVFLPAVRGDALIEAAYGAIARDGARTIEVGTTLRKALADLSQAADEELRAQAIQTARQAMDYAQTAGLTEFEMRRLSAILVPASPH
ncbi:DUF2254 domain-containing protein [Pontivivens insulae]|uniref:DUF2254 domain-containing protein n=1 Tax=Pontivivens insulae TaxID=1639689 RepID=A0A2R8AFB1_9RHOB|nr:DUF2254 domain-containing protein [Pontivivens insulae]RED12120.1 putative membrane protein [Pontivivens insulae]SPF30876.1 hypothetical protein POI8812_03221 [Pontivivens insulae]